MLHDNSTVSTSLAETIEVTLSRKFAPALDGVEVMIPVRPWHLQRTSIGMRKFFIKHESYASLFAIARNQYFAPAMIMNYRADIGRRYMVWTRGMEISFRNTAWFHRNLLSIVLKPPHVRMIVRAEKPTKKTRVSLTFRCEDYREDILLAEARQEIVFQQPETGRMISWAKVPTLATAIGYGANPCISRQLPDVIPMSIDK